MSGIVTEELTLKNGMKIIGEINPHAQSVGIGFFVKTGSRDEVVQESGVSHFLEHMMFKGTPKRSALDISFELGNIGAQANAFTSEENTVYYAQVLPEYLENMQELLSDMLRPSIDINEFNTEKNVILEEIALYQDRPQFYLFEKAQADFFKGHTAGNSVLGSNESITALSRDQMKDYFDRRYAPDNIVLVAAGNLDWKKFTLDAEKFCGGWIPSNTKREIPPFISKPSLYTYRRPNLNRGHVLLLGMGPSIQQDEIRYPLSILMTIIGDSSGSELYWRLVETGLADSASADTEEKDGVGLISFYASTDIDRVDEVSKIMKDVAAKARDFKDDALQRAKTKLISRVVLHGELPMGRLMALGLEWNYKHKITSLEKTLSIIKGITRNDINKALDQYPLGNFSEFRLLPE